MTLRPAKADSRRTRPLFAALVLSTILSASAMLAAPAGGVPLADAAEKRPVLRGLYNSRYCEIFGISTVPTGGYSVATFNSVGLGSCPQAKWAGLDFQAIASSEGWLAATPHGPRYWLMDSICGTKRTDPKAFGGIRMRKVATLETDDLQPPPFTELELQLDSWRGTAWTFRRGRQVHSLTDPAGNRYLMQAYTRTEDPTLNPRRLANLGSNPKAAIPDGWKFSTKKLRRPLVLNASEKVTIIRDGVRSIYQKIE